MADIRQVLVIFTCAAFALLNALGALMAAWVGLRGHGSSVDYMLAKFNVVSGIVCLVSFIGIALRKRWSLWAWTLATSLFFIGHAIITIYHWSTMGHFELKLLVPAVLPLIALAAWFLLFLEYRRGGLK